MRNQPCSYYKYIKEIRDRPKELENEVVRASIRITPTMIVALACIKSPARPV
jgi:hypothetical protein